jgi:hypothetical protein
MANLVTCPRNYIPPVGTFVNMMGDIFDMAPNFDPSTWLQLNRHPNVRATVIFSAASRREISPSFECIIDIFFYTKTVCRTYKIVSDATLSELSVFYILYNPASTLTRKRKGSGNMTRVMASLVCILNFRNFFIRSKAFRTSTSTENFPSSTHPFAIPILFASN